MNFFVKRKQKKKKRNMQDRDNETLSYITGYSYTKF